MKMLSTNRCPLSGKEGIVLRQLTGRELFDLYQSYYNHPLPEPYFERYFAQNYEEYYCEESGLRWYSPGILGDGDYYQTLQETYDWYYNPASWDKLTCLKTLHSLSSDWLLEVGCGDGWLLRELAATNLITFGIEINPASLAKAKEDKLNVFSPEQAPERPSGKGCLALLQTIEHLENPVEILQNYVTKYQPDHLIISAPCFDSLLGVTSDPLSWPPHHYTAWSKKSMTILGQSIGYKLTDTQYSPLNRWLYEWRCKREIGRPDCALPKLNPGIIGDIQFQWEKWKNNPLFTRGHSIFCVFCPTR